MRFLLAPLHLDSLEDEITKKAIRLGLKNLPKGSTAVNETYDKAIKRIERQPPKRSARAKTVLSWITYAERQLTTTELCHALAVEEGDLELDEDNIPDIEDITSVCAGLVEVDKESNVIRLVHYTTQEYFERVREGWNPKAQEEIASTCLTYLSFETFNTGHCNNDADFGSRLRQNPFLDYAARYWGNHAFPVQEAIKGLALPFLSNMRQVACSSQVMLAQDNWRMSYSQLVAKDLTGIHLAVVFKLTYLLQELTCCDGNENYIPINSRDSIGKTPLSWAAEKGHEVIVKLLVDRDDVVADSTDNHGRTPLAQAAEQGHEEVVKLLAMRDDVITDSKDNDDKTPLMWAALSGHEAVVKLLLERDDVAADSKDNNDRTPLGWAAWNGHEAVVKLLVEQDDVEANAKDLNGQTPLSGAAQWWNEAVVRLLLKRNNVDANSKDNDGCTPLWWALKYTDWERKGTQETIVKLLLERDDVFPDSKNNHGETPLSIAASSGNEAVVKLLLEGGAVADLKDNGGQTPLSQATRQRHEGVVKLLLKQDVVADSKDNSGRTPLSWAAEVGHEAVVKLLLKQDNVIADSKDNYGRTPLSWAARWGGEGVVKLLLKQDVVADSKDNSGRTPLAWAAEEGQEAVVKLLIKRDDVDANSEDTDGHTPLWWSTKETDFTWLQNAELIRKAEAKREAIAKLIAEHIAKRKEAL